MKTKIIAFTLAWCFIFPVVVSGQGEAEGAQLTLDDIIDQITEDMVRGYIQTLQDIGPRVTGTEGCSEAANYISAQFKGYGLSVREDPWSNDNYEDINIEGSLKGVNKSSDEVYIVCAHYDTVPESPGADDDGSGTAAVLAAAQVLSNYDFQHTIRFVTFSGEEEGLLGSEKYAEEARDKGENIVGVLNADMIGYTETELGSTYVKVQEIPSSMWITNISINLTRAYPEEIDLEVERGPSHPYSDHASFINYGYNATYFFEYEFNDYYHSPEDTIDKMDLDYATRVTKLIVGTLVELAELAPGDWESPVVAVKKPYHGLYFQNKKIMPLPLITIVFGGIEIEVSATDNETGVQRVEFYIDGEHKFSDADPPYTYMWDERAVLRHSLEVRGYDEAGNKATDELQVWIFNI